MPKSIVLINLKPPYELKASTMRMASPGRTSTIQQVLIGETEIVTQDLVWTEHNNNDDDEHTKLPMTAESFTGIFSASHTVIIPDSMFVDKSHVFHHTQNFVQHGLEPLQAFYQGGGTVLVQCVEGALSSACTTQINTLFGTDWKIHVLADAITLGPTKRAQKLFESPYLPQEIVLNDSAFYLSCPEDEGLYKVLLPTREEFEKSFQEQDEVFERLGIEKDASMDCFDVDKSWNDYVRKYSDRYGIAMHAVADTGRHHHHRGHVIWYGDRSQANRTISFIFCKLLNIGTLGEDDDDDSDEGALMKRGVNSFPSGMIVTAVVIVLLAIVAKLMGF